MARQTLKEIRRNTKPNSLEISSAVALKWQAIIHSARRIHARQLDIGLAYCNQFRRGYNAIALDYDGTLISLLSRTSTPSSRLIHLLGEVLDYGLPVVIISGRGKSLLQLSELLDRFDRNSLFLAMYNGARIVRGAATTTIADNKVSLVKAFRQLKDDETLKPYVRKWVLKEYAIQAIPRRKSQTFMDRLCDLLESSLPVKLMARNSGFALDVYPAGRTKDRCLEFITKYLGRQIRFLRIADQGHTLGNDYELLNSKGGFSVGTLSDNPTMCFPVIDDRGKRPMGPDGAEYVLGNMFELP